MSFRVTLFFSFKIYLNFWFIEQGVSISEQLNLFAIAAFHQFKLQNNSLTISCLFYFFVFVVYSCEPTKLKVLLFVVYSCEPTKLKVLLFVVYSCEPTKLKVLLFSTVFRLSFELSPLLTHFFIYFRASFKAAKRYFVYFLSIFCKD